MKRDSFVPCKYSELPNEAGLIMVCCPDESHSATPRIISITKTGNIRQLANLNVVQWKSHCSSVELEYFVALQPNSTLDFRPSSLRHRIGGTIDAELVETFAVCC